jgi:phosphoserine phosphatase
MAIDSVTVTDQDAEQLSGTISREYPPSDKGLRWRFEGTRVGFAAIFVYFSPLDQNNPSSRGIIALQQVENRPFRYRGTLTRLAIRGPRHELISRAHTLYLPDTYRRVAILDLDDWLLTRTALISWLRFLDSRSVVSSRECLRLEERLAGHFRQGQIGRDELADRCARAYAEVINGQAVAGLDSEMDVFISGVEADRRRRFAERLVKAVMTLGVVPIIVTRAPIELAKKYAQLLDVDEVYGLLLGAVDEPESRYDGTIINNPGTSLGRRTVVEAVDDAQREIVLAVGSEWTADDPLWKAAPCRIVLQNGQVPLDAADVLIVQPLAPNWAEITQWLNTHLRPNE